MKQLKAIKSFCIAALAMAVICSIAHAGPVLAAESESGDTVWLHVIHGNFSGKYKGYEGEDMTKEASVRVKLGPGRTLPAEVRKISATRTNGTFAGWYTASAHETLKDSEDGSYCVWSTEYTNGSKIEPGSGKVPEDVNVLYAVFKDKKKVKKKDKLVAYYMDWNGINGRYGRCLTCIRSYNGGEVYFKPESAAVFGLNYEASLDERFNSLGKDWNALKTIWEENEFNGYTFLGWSAERHGSLIDEDTKIKNGMSFYAQWTKGDLSSKDFEPDENPDAGPLEFIRIAGDGLNASLSAGKHAQKGASFTLTMLRNPIYAKANDVTWSISIGNGLFKTDKVTVAAGGRTYYMSKSGEKGLMIEAEGYALTITNLDGGEYGISVGVTAQDSGDGGGIISAPANASLTFRHAWDKGTVQKEATCEERGSIHYTCTEPGCGKEEDRIISPLEHVYERTLDGARYYDVLKAPTCTENGLKQYRCLRCGETNGPKAFIPATGHNWKPVGGRPLNCQTVEYTDICTNHDCGMTRTREAYAFNPALHDYRETIIPMNCSQAEMVRTCAVCGDTKRTTIGYDNPEGPHVWGDWKTTKAPTLEAKGEQTRICHLCKKEETRILPQLAIGIRPSVDPGKPVPETEEPSADSGEPVQETEEPSADVAADNSAIGRIARKAGNKSAAVSGEKKDAGKSEAETGWQTVNGKKYYFDADGVMQKNGVKTIKGKKYYFDKNGVMKTGWKTIGKKKYYFNAKGVMQKNGIKTIKGKKYYFDKNGAMKTGWKTIKGKKYYFGKNGVMKTGKRRIHGRIYRFKSNGVLAKQNG